MFSLGYFPEFYIPYNYFPENYFPDYEDSSPLVTAPVIGWFSNILWLDDNLYSTEIEGISSTISLGAVNIKISNVSTVRLSLGGGSPVRYNLLSFLNDEDISEPISVKINGEILQTKLKSVKIKIRDLLYDEDEDALALLLILNQIFFSSKNNKKEEFKFNSDLNLIFSEILKEEDERENIVEDKSKINEDENEILSKYILPLLIKRF